MFCRPVALTLLLAVTLTIIPATSKAAISEQEALAIGVDAYLYFYPIITMDVTRKQSTNIEPGKSFDIDKVDPSLDLYFQNESPGAGKEANWLPAPKRPFNLAMRLYAPKREVLVGKWNPPPVVRGQ